MKILELIRLEESERGTIGILKIDKRVICFTLELQDLLNKQMVSSIPAQQYRCLIHQLRDGRSTFRVQGVPGRTGIDFHSGDGPEDTHGCIILATKLARYVNPSDVVDGSREAFRLFMDLCEDQQEIHLTITENY